MVQNPVLVSKIIKVLFIVVKPMFFLCWASVVDNNTTLPQFVYLFI